MPIESMTTLAKTVLSASFGIALGLFVGILVVGTLIRIIFSLLFGWGDSAPTWGLWTEGIMIAGATLASLYFSLKWTLGTKKRI